MSLIKSMQLSINSLFKRFKFFEISNSDGNTLLFDGDVIKVGDEVKIRDAEGNITIAPDGEYKLVLPNGMAITITITDGLISKIINAETQEELQDVNVGENVGEPQPAEQSAHQETEKVEQAKKEKTAFQKYMSEQYLNDVSMEEYPWEQCIADMQEQGVDCPECVCAAIKNRTVAHHIAQGKTLEGAIKQVIADVKSNPTAQYILKKLASDVPKKQEQPQETPQEPVQQSNVEELKKEISEIKQSLKDLGALTLKLSSMKQFKQLKNNILDDRWIEEYRTKYYYNGQTKTNK